MFELYKLNKYSDNIVGFAYDQGKSGSLSHIVNTYLVVNINDNIKFIPYIKHKRSSSLGCENLIEDLEKNGYKCLSYYINEKPKKKKANILRLIK